MAADQEHQEQHWKLLAARTTLGASLRTTAWLFGRWFSTYRKLFVLVVGANGLLLGLSRHGLVDWQPDAATVATANIFLAVLFRNELFVHLLHRVFVGACNPAIVPLRVRLQITSCLLYMGGMHSGFAVSGAVWLGVGLFAPAGPPEAAAPLLRMLGYLLLSLLTLMSLLATKPVREACHNLFEYSHRYLGWTGLAVLWGFVWLSASGDPPGLTGHIHRLLAAAAFWLTLGITVVVLVPWLTVRKVRVKTYSPSSGVIAIKFGGGFGVGAFGRISRTRLGDWHTFALVSRTRHATSHLMIVSAVGDFTQGLISTPPAELYVRAVKFLGLPYSLQSYNRAVIVATGAGIAPFMPLLLQAQHANYHVVWIGRAFRETFGRRLSDLVLHWPQVTVWDTALKGRPNTLALAEQAYRAFGAEVVFIGCNPVATRELVYGCSALGIPAFGPSWDS